MSAETEVESDIMSPTETKPSSLRTSDLLLEVNSRGRRDGQLKSFLFARAAEQPAISRVSGTLANSRVVVSATRSPRWDYFIVNKVLKYGHKMSHRVTDRRRSDTGTVETTVQHVGL